MNQGVCALISYQCFWRPNLGLCCLQVTKFMALLLRQPEQIKELARKAEHIYAKALGGYCARLVENV